MPTDEVLRHLRVEKLIPPVLPQTPADGVGRRIVDDVYGEPARIHPFDGQLGDILCTGDAGSRTECAHQDAQRERARATARRERSKGVHLTRRAADAEGGTPVGLDLHGCVDLTGKGVYQLEPQAPSHCRLVV